MDPLGLLRCGEIGILGSPGKTVNHILDQGTDLGLVATTVFVESSARYSPQGADEMGAIAGVIVNRYNIVNNFAPMARDNGTVQAAPRAWGAADGKMSSIVINPSQFEVWRGPGGTLTQAASRRLADAVGADADSNLCKALLNAIGNSNEALRAKGRRALIVDRTTDLAYTGFNSFPYEQKYDWEEIGDFGSANRFYGIPIPIPTVRRNAADDEGRGGRIGSPLPRRPEGEGGRR